MPDEFCFGFENLMTSGAHTLYRSSNEKWRHIRFCSFHKAKKWRFDLPRFPSICNPSGSFPFKPRVGRCCRHTPSTLKVKLLAKDNISLSFWRKITESRLSSNGGFYTFAKLMLLRLLVRDWVITLSEIADNLRNNLDEVLLAMVCTVYIGNIYNRSRFSLKVNTVEARYPRACGGKDKLNRIVEVSIQFPYLLVNTVFLCKK